MSDDLGNSSCYHPSLPTSLSDAITLHYLSQCDRERLARHLDIESAWKYVAEALGMKTIEITWISNRETLRGSHTLLLIRDLEKAGVTLKRFMKAVNDSSYKVVPVINFLNERYPEIEKKFYQEQTHLLHTATGKSSKSHFLLLEKSPFQKYRKNVSLIYRQQDSKQMLHVGRCLLKNGFAVNVDRPEQLTKDSLTTKNGDVLRIQKIPASADYTLLLISPSFLKSIVKSSDLPTEDSNPDASIVHFAKMMKSVPKNSKKAKEFVVVLVEGATEGDLPGWLRGIRTFHWPKDYKGLLFFLMDETEIVGKMMVEQAIKSNSLGKMALRQSSCSSRCSSHRK